MPFRIVFFCCLLALLVGCATTAPTNRPVETFIKQGEDSYQNKKYEDAIAQWKRAKESGNISPALNAMTDLRIADAQFENKSYIEAGAAYENFRKFHPNHPSTPYALFRLGLCYYNQITGISGTRRRLRTHLQLLTVSSNSIPYRNTPPQRGRSWWTALSSRSSMKSTSAGSTSVSANIRRPLNVWKSAWPDSPGTEPG